MSEENITLTLGGASYDITPLSEILDVPQSLVNVTVEVGNVVGRGPRDKYRTTTTILDRTCQPAGLVCWDDPLREELREYSGEYVAICRAEVGEFRDRPQLTAINGTTEIYTLERGVGYITPTTPEAEKPLDERAEYF